MKPPDPGPGGRWGSGGSTRTRGGSTGREHLTRGGSTGREHTHKGREHKEGAHAQGWELAGWFIEYGFHMLMETRDP